MKTWEQFLESKKPADNTTSKLDCIMDIARALQGIFKKHTMITRNRAWDRLMSKAGEKEIRKLLHTPTRSLSPFRTLVP